MRCWHATSERSRLWRSLLPPAWRVFRSRASGGVAGSGEPVFWGLIVIYGPGATLVHPGDVLVYADLPRWEIQQRMRRGETGNWGADNQQEDMLRRYKRAFLSNGASSIATKRRCSGAPIFTGYNPDEPARDGQRRGPASRAEANYHPAFPRGALFDRRLGRPVDETAIRSRSSAPNYAWCFDCVPEENSLLLRFGAVRIEIPSQDLVLLEPRALLGESSRTFRRGIPDPF